MRYGDIVTDVLNLCGQPPGSDFDTMAKSAINRVYRRMLQLVSQDLERREFSLTTVAATSKYGMPLYVNRILNIEDTANKRVVYDISAREFDVDYPGTTLTGDPFKAYILGNYGVQTQNPAASTVTVESSSAADTGANYKVRLSGFSSSQWATEEITLSGTTAVASANTYDVGGMERITTSPTPGVAFNGAVTLKHSTDTSPPVHTTLAIIPVGYDSTDYIWIEFQPIPDTARTYVIRALMRKPGLINDNDWPEIELSFQSLLVWGACAEIMPAVGKHAQAAQMRLDYDNGLVEFQGEQQEHPNRIRVFADITTAPSIQRRPLIKGVHFV